MSAPTERRLPLAARQAAWNELWRVLLSPPDDAPPSVELHAAAFDDPEPDGRGSSSRQPSGVQ